MPTELYRIWAAGGSHDSVFSAVLAGGVSGPLRLALLSSFPAAGIPSMSQRTHAGIADLRLSPRFPPTHRQTTLTAKPRARARRTGGGARPDATGASLVYAGESSAGNRSSVPTGGHRPRTGPSSTYSPLACQTCRQSRLPTQF
jgi:hypothetical protein